MSTTNQVEKTEETVQNKTNLQVEQKQARPQSCFQSFKKKFKYYCCCINFFNKKYDEEVVQLCVRGLTPATEHPSPNFISDIQHKFSEKLDLLKKITPCSTADQTPENQNMNAEKFQKLDDFRKKSRLGIKVGLPMMNQNKELVQTLQQIYTGKSIYHKEGDTQPSEIKLNSRQILSDQQISTDEHTDNTSNNSGNHQHILHHQECKSN